MITLDFSNVPTREPLEEGIYELVIIEAEMTTSRKGSEMLKVTLEEPESKNRLWENFVIQENTLWKLKEFLDCFGFDTSGTLDVDPSELVGVTLKAKVIQDTYNEQTVNRVQKFFAN